jgi:plasmid stabilization system protein ParE
VKEFVLRPATVADLRKAYRWYEAERPGLGEEFLRAVRATIGSVVTTPLAYAVVHRETRRALVARFPYGVFFRLVGETIVIVACYHLHRKPASWKRRR